ncbi:MAG: uracil-DNA glycosylase family protein, partial [Alphaproteobacteria bacterium]|nr:uracil-DNA glycosylase family protein [Alphaproteobacteria bacterium]
PQGGDAPPMSECAATWHGRVLAALPAIALTLLVGGYAQKHYLGAAAKAGVGATVADWRAHLPATMPLPHPSWRTRAWVAKRPWFESELLPALRDRLAALLARR